MTHKHVVPIRISDKNKRESSSVPLVLNIFGKRYIIESRIRIVEVPRQRAVPTVISKAGSDRGC